MLLTRFVRNQLIIFTIASIVGVAVMVFTYMQLPALLGIGHIKVCRVKAHRHRGMGHAAPVTPSLARVRIPENYRRT